jgi:hypothetical protein
MKFNYKLKTYKSYTKIGTTLRIVCFVLPAMGGHIIQHCIVKNYIQ